MCVHFSFVCYIWCQGLSSISSRCRISVEPKFFWLLGRLGLGVRSWVHIGLGVRLGGTGSYSDKRYSYKHYSDSSYSDMLSMPEFYA